MVIPMKARVLQFDFVNRYSYIQNFSYRHFVNFKNWREPFTRWVHGSSDFSPTAMHMGNFNSKPRERILARVEEIT